MKEPIGTFEALPSKRIYNPIITDYDFEKSICELVDNAIDIWVKNSRSIKLKILINLNPANQTITIIDNAGGIKKDDLYLIVAPGQTSNLLSDETIGIFGVGSKRAVVHLSNYIIIKTHHKDDLTYEINYDEVWLKDESTWSVNIFKVDNIPEGETRIELMNLRYSISDKLIDKVRIHLSEVYAKFLHDDNLLIELNDIKLFPIEFENFSGHPDYSPQGNTISVMTTVAEKAIVRIVSGICVASSISDYGVYLYCNNRLVVKAVKDENVGAYVHNECGRAKIFVYVSGPVDMMPWNSSKSNFNYNNEVYNAIREKLKEITSHYLKLSRSISTNKLGKEVSEYPVYKINEKDLGFIEGVKKIDLPVIPAMRRSKYYTLNEINSEVLDSKPWTRGAFESIQAVELISTKSFEQKNRIALIVLDSALETGLKDYLVFQSGHTYTEKDLNKIFDTINSSRRNVIKEVRQYIMTGATYEKYWNKVEYYYKKRCDFIHSTSTTFVSPIELDEYKKTVEFILAKLFGIIFHLS